MTTQTFIDAEFAKLNFYTSQILKVHGAHHPELAVVRDLFVTMQEKVATTASADLTPELTQLAAVTNNYEVPADGCEAYQATYQLLHQFHSLALAG